jgi:hypothetical protein
MSHLIRNGALGAIALLAAAPALAAETAKENYSYTAPSGMFSEGTTKWQMYRFMAEDAERTRALNQGLSTGSVPSTVQGSAINDETVGQRGRRTTRRTN